MQAKIIIILMLSTLAILFLATGRFRKYEEKISKFERFFFKKITQENGSIEKIKNEVIEYGRKLGLKDDKISSLIRENSL